MKLKTPRMLRTPTFCPQLFLVLVAATLTMATVTAQEKQPFDKPAKPATKSDVDSKIPEAIKGLIPSIVTVTRVETAGGDPNKKLLSHLGVVVDTRGFIAIPMLPGPAKSFVVRLSNQQEVMGELILTDDSLKVALLKIDQSQPIKAVSLDKIRSTRKEERILLVPSSTNSELRSGRILSTTFSFGDEIPTKLLQTDIACPLSEFGSLMVSEANEPIGLVLTSRSDPKPTSIVVPLKEIQSLLQTAIDKPKEAPLVRVPQSSPGVDIHKPISITLQPVPPLAKSLVELFTPRGAKILEHEEGKRLKIEAPPLVLEEIANLLGLVANEEKKTPDKNLPSNKFKLDLQPATPLIKSLVELFAKRGANVLEYKEGKRLQIEAPAQTMEDLGKILEIVGRASLQINDKNKASGPATTPPPDQQEDRANQQTAPEVSESVHPKPLSYILPGAADSREVTKIFHLQSSDVATMFEVVETLFQGKVRRISADRRTNTLIVVGLPIICDEIEAILLKLEAGPPRQLPGKVDQSRFALPGTPAAKQLIEQIAALESAAATEATTIRQLQATKEAAETIAKHQSQLRAHLQNAFDLKMQLEEFQVKELQLRLSRLERQIGQRKEIREKIIDRRASELISADTLR